MRMISFSRAIGKGAAALETFGKYLDTPYLGHTAYQNLFEYHLVAAAEVAKTSMTKAAEELQETSDNGDISVSVDGTWQRRGHASHNGVVTVISVDTGKCLDYEVLSNTCKSCEVWSKKDKDSIKYQIWQNEHEPKCSMNHTGSGSSMEPNGAVAIFSRSEDTRGLRYVKYLGMVTQHPSKKCRTPSPMGIWRLQRLNALAMFKNEWDPDYAN